jgi:hypothetical protein
MTRRLTVGSNMIWISPLKWLWTVFIWEILYNEPLKQLTIRVSRIYTFSIDMTAHTKCYRPLSGATTQRVPTVGTPPTQILRLKATVCDDLQLHLICLPPLLSILKLSQTACLRAGLSTFNHQSQSQSQSQTYVTIDDQAASFSWGQVSSWSQKRNMVADRLVLTWCKEPSLMKERVCSLILLARHRQRSHSRVRVQRNSWRYFNLRFESSLSWGSRCMCL